jgi:hypothetical protein
MESLSHDRRLDEEEGTSEKYEMLLWASVFSGTSI